MIDDNLKKLDDLFASLDSIKLDEQSKKMFQELKVFSKNNDIEGLKLLHNKALDYANSLNDKK